ncbi:MAG: hypothetical protein H6652_23325 [Ardenticatenaceae bacterium]|nr:hypothetical protein [Ardenticatenaceae bacterium]
MGTRHCKSESVAIGVRQDDQHLPDRWLWFIIAHWLIAGNADALNLKDIADSQVDERLLDIEVFNADKGLTRAARKPVILDSQYG